MTKGFLLVIEGVDGSGKTTQIELLSQFFKENAAPFEVINFPRYGENAYTDLITKYLEGKFGPIGQIDPHFIALSYAGDRSLAKDQINTWLSEGKIVIANRYVSSSKAHLGANIAEAKRTQFIEWIDDLEYKTNKIPKEDLTILLSVDVNIGQKNALGDGITDIHEQDLNHLQKAAKVYTQLAEGNPRWVIVNCMENGIMQNKEDINQQILRILEEKKII